MGRRLWPSGSAVSSLLFPFIPAILASLLVSAALGHSGDQIWAKFSSPMGREALSLISIFSFAKTVFLPIKYLLLWPLVASMEAPSLLSRYHRFLVDYEINSCCFILSHKSLDLASLIIFIQRFHPPSWIFKILLNWRFPFPLPHTEIQWNISRMLSSICQRSEQTGKKLVQGFLDDHLVPISLGMGDVFLIYFCIHSRPVFAAIVVESFWIPFLTFNLEARHAVLGTVQISLAIEASLRFGSSCKPIQGLAFPAMDSSLQYLFVMAFYPKESSPTIRRPRARAKQWQRRPSSPALRRQMGPQADACLGAPSMLTAWKLHGVKGLDVICSFLSVLVVIWSVQLSYMYSYFCTYVLL